MSDGNTIILGAGNLRRRERTTKGGKTSVRYTVEIKGDSLVARFDAKQLAAGPAQAIAQHLRERIESISAPASDATMRARTTALKAFVHGKPWALKRYGGGRLGSMPPARTDRAFNDSGRFAKSIVAKPNKDGDGWTINVAANRLDPKSIGEAGVTRVWARLVALVPEFAQPSLMSSSIPVRKAIQESTRALMQKASEAELQQKIREMEQRIDAAIGLAAAIVGG